MSPRALGVAAALLLIAAASFGARTFQYLRLPAGAERVVFADPDSLYHFRVATAVAESFPRVPAFDWYLNYPLGAPIPLPPFQDLLCAGIALALGGGARTLELVCFLYPAALGALAPALVYLLARLIGVGAAGGLAGAALFTLVPAVFQYTQAGRFDHHAGDMVLALAWYAALLGIWRTRAGAARAALAPITAAAAALAAAHLNFLGAPLHAAVAVAALLAGAALARRAEPRYPAFLARAAAALAGAAALHALAIGALFGPGRLGTLAYNLPGGFQSLALAGAALVVALAGLAAARGRAALRSAPFWCAAAALAGILALAAGTIAAGVGRYFTAPPATMRNVLENVSPFRLAGLRGTLPGFSPRSGAGYLTYLVFLVPVALVLPVRRALAQREGRDFPALLLVTWAVVQTLLAALQARYGVLFAAPAAILAGWLIESLWRAARRTEAPAARRIAAAAAAALCIAAVQPGFQPLRVRWNNPYAGLLNVDLGPPMAWLAASSPDPGGGFDPARRPAYGVMAAWDTGYNVVSGARRPCIVSGYLEDLPGGLFEQAGRFFLEKSPARAAEIMAGNDLRYLLLRNLPDTLGQLGAPPPADAATADPRTLPATLRLWVREGSAALVAGEPVPAAGRFRLLREDEFYYHRSQIWELVAGARLRGRAAPGDLVVASIELTSGRGRPFLYQEIARAGADGAFELPAPYASTGANGLTRARGPWRVGVYPAGPRAQADVSERQVLEGAAVAVALGAAPGP